MSRTLPSAESNERDAMALAAVEAADQRSMEARLAFALGQIDDYTEGAYQDAKRKLVAQYGTSRKPLGSIGGPPGVAVNGRREDTTGGSSTPRKSRTDKKPAQHDTNEGSSQGLTPQQMSRRARLGQDNASRTGRGS